jgi:hypothetical protein
MGDSVICKFCNMPTKHVPQESICSGSFDYYFCYPCKTEYTVILENNKLKQYSFSIYTTINNCHFKYYENAIWIAVLSIETLGIPGKSLNKGQKVVFKCHHHASFSVNPSNVNEKLPTIINFS